MRVIDLIIGAFILFVFIKVRGDRELLPTLEAQQEDSCHCYEYTYLDEDPETRQIYRTCDRLILNYHNMEVIEIPYDCKTVPSIPLLSNTQDADLYQ